jgi:mono/diheme cytochrome c family protein
VSAEQLTRRILYGGRDMPTYGTNLRADELAALVAFLATLDGRPRPEREAGAPTP